MRRAIVVMLWGLVATPVFAIDTPITGAKLVLKQSRSGKHNFLFQSKDPNFPLYEGDPRSEGATIEVITPGVTPSPFVAPRNAVQPGWTVDRGYKYKRDKAFAATTPIKTIVMKDGHGISIRGEATGIPLDGARALVAIRVTVGDSRSCARFAGASVTKDAAGAFTAKNASTEGFTDCEVTSLTGAPAACGDGDVNQPSEGCDGSCPLFDGALMCRPPGTSNECQCCWDGGPIAGVACCNPSAIHITYPPSYGSCVATRCDPPDDCTPGDVCQADHSCCSPIGNRPCVQAWFPPYNLAMIPLNACCPGLECGRVDPLGGGAFCCASGGTSCGADGDCCTRHCQPGGTCEACRAAGTACATNQECCSGACSGGVCAACAGTGAFCSSGATCCSGTCTKFQCE